MKGMTADRLVIVNAAQLDELCELALGAAARLEPTDRQLGQALRGSVAELRTTSLIESLIEPLVHEPA
jgi:hypothetical protein